MAGKTTKRKTAFIIGIVAIVLGFVIGEMVPLPVFNNINLRATMMRPGGLHHRASF